MEVLWNLLREFNYITCGFNIEKIVLTSVCSHGKIMMFRNINTQKRTDIAYEVYAMKVDNIDVRPYYVDYQNNILTLTML